MVMILLWLNHSCIISYFSLMKLSSSDNSTTGYLDIKILHSTWRALRCYLCSYENGLIRTSDRSHIKIYSAVRLFLTLLKITSVANNLSGTRGWFLCWFLSAQQHGWSMGRSQKEPCVFPSVCFLWTQTRELPDSCNVINSKAAFPTLFKTTRSWFMYGLNQVLENNMFKCFHTDLSLKVGLKWTC